MNVPYRLSIEFTNWCNFRCTMCPQSVYGKKSLGGNPYNRKRGWLTDDVLGMFIEDARKYARSVSVGYFGEPMLHPKFGEYIERLADKRAYKLILFTNGSMLRKKNATAAMQCDVVKISLDAADAETFKKVCPTGNYVEIVSNIDQWLDMEGHPETYLIYVQSSLNGFTDKAAFLKQWVPKLPRRDSIITKSVISYGGVMKDECMGKNHCRVLNKPRMVVAWNGDCTPCNLDVNVRMNVGNIVKDGGLARIVGLEDYHYWINQIRHKRDLCLNCFDANNHKVTKFHRGAKCA